jgi:serine protease Do
MTLAAWLPALAHAQVLAPIALFEKLSPSVFMVITYAGTEPKARRLATGSAVVIGPETVITNCNVLRKSQRVEVVNGPVVLQATLEFPDVERDLCQMRVPGLAAPAVVLGSSAGLRIGQRVYAIGAPQGFELTLSDGLVSSLRTMVTKDRIEPWIQTSAPISPGSSGGGLFDEQGQLIGITTLSSLIGNLAFAVPAEQVREVPERGRLALAADATRRAEAAAKLKESEATGKGQRLVGNTLAQHFTVSQRTYVFVRGGNQMRSLSLRGANLTAVENDGRATSGTVRIDPARNVVCFTVNQFGVHRSAESMHDCFEVWDIGSGEFEMRLPGQPGGMAYRIQ